MLLQGDTFAQSLGGQKDQWQHPFGKSEFSAILDNTSVWLSVYADSVMGLDNQNVLDVLGSTAFQQQLSSIGIKAIHTGPLKLSGSVQDGEYGPSIDGHFDRIESTLDPAYGDQSQYNAMVQNAADHGITIIGDLVPGHTGKGPDFRLAEKNVPGFPNLYTMLEVHPEHWSVLSEVPPKLDSINLSQSKVTELKQLGYAVIAPMNAEVFARPNIKESCWSATDVIEGVDGINRRWVYLHIFKQGQPSLNWTDPSFAAYRMQIADVLHSLKLLGTRGLRMDATMFLGVEARPDEDKSCLAGHPLSTRVTDLLAMMIRKFGGFSFQELNIELDKLRDSLSSGPEFNYDFTTRPNYLYALVTGDGGPLRLILREMLKYNVQPRRMVHGMQNHDELMLEATHFTIHAAQTFEYEDTSIRGDALFTKVPETVLAKCTGEHGKYNRAFAMSPGVCTTFAGLIAATIGLKELSDIPPQQIQQIKHMHLLAAAFNALQGGIFNISGWDLVGAIPLTAESVSTLLEDNDHRWINRGGYDLLGLAGDQSNSIQGLPKAVSLYGSIPAQLEDPDSFISILKPMLALRESLGIANSELIDVPQIQDKALVILVNQLPATDGFPDRWQITALNFGATKLFATVDSPGLENIATALWSNQQGTKEQSLACDNGKIALELKPFEAKLLVAS